jgi:TonB family protein
MRGRLLTTRKRLRFALSTLMPDWFRLRTRLITLLFSFAAVVLLMVPSLKPNAFAGTPQGKGGEVIAKPTPTPSAKKTAAKKKTAARNSRTSRQAQPPSDSAAAAEMTSWNSIKDSTNPDDFKVYLKKYPDGEFAELAKNKLKTLEPVAQPTPSPTDSRPAVKDESPKSDDYTRVFAAREVDERAKILSNPRPDYTEDARHNNIQGPVVLRLVLAASGEVTNITVVRGLPFGLSEKAIAAARNIKFQPARKDGHQVSQSVQLTFTFSLY